MGCSKDYNSKIKYIFQIITLLSLLSFVQGCGPGTFESLSNEVKKESPPSIADSNGRGPSCSDGATQSCGSDVGICQSGIQTCSGQEWGSCVDEIAAGPELCGDGLDNDCDGSVDDGCSGGACTPGTTQSCGSNVGACQSGTETCNEGEWSLCIGEIGPTKEICGDGIDNDCNGLFHVGCSGEVCTDGETRNCGGPEIGACQYGTETCNGGEWSACNGEVAPTAEVCSDGVDNNCNGSTDESCTPVAACSKQSGSDWVNEPNWPVTSIVLGNKSYSQSELLAIINRVGDDMSIDLSASLVGALLNYAAGAAPSIDLSTAQQWMIDFDDGDGLPYAVNLSDPGAVEALAIIAYIDSYNSDAVACEVNSTNVVPLTCANVAPLADVVPPQSLAGTGGYFTSTSKLGVVKTMQGEIKLSASIDDNLEVRVNNWLEVAKPYFGLSDISKDLELLEIIDLDTNESAESIFTKPNANISVRFIRKINYLKVLGSGLVIRVQSTADATTGLPVVSIKFIWSKLPYNDMLVSEHDLIGNNRAKLNGLEGLTATEAEVEQVVFSGTTQNGCANFSRLAWKVTPANPSSGDPGFRIIDGGHGGILMSQRTVFEAIVVDSAGQIVPAPHSEGQVIVSNNVDGVVEYFINRGLDPGDQSVFYSPEADESAYYSRSEYTNSQGDVVGQDIIVIAGFQNTKFYAGHEVAHDVFNNVHDLDSSAPQSSAINEAYANLHGEEYADVLYAWTATDAHTDDSTPPFYSPHSEYPNYFEHKNAEPIQNAFYCAKVGCPANENGGQVDGVGQEALEMFDEALKYAGGGQKNLTFEELYDLVRNAGLKSGKQKACGAVLKALNRNGIGEPDLDQDCFTDEQDNCPTQFNPLQDDDNDFQNDDGIGDACEYPTAANSFKIVWDYGVSDSANFHSKLESCPKSTASTGSANASTYRKRVGLQNHGTRTNGFNVLPGSKLQGTFEGLPADSHSFKGVAVANPWKFTNHWPYLIGDQMANGAVDFHLMLRPFVGGDKWCGGYIPIYGHGWSYKPYGSAVAERKFTHNFKNAKFTAENGDVWIFSSGSSGGYYKSYDKRVTIWLTKQQ